MALEKRRFTPACRKNWSGPKKSFCLRRQKTMFRCFWSTGNTYDYRTLNNKSFEVRLMYATGNVTCKYRQIIYYYDSKSGFFNFQVRDDVVALRAFYENIVEDEQFPLLTEFFDDNSTTYMRSGCNTVSALPYSGTCMPTSYIIFIKTTKKQCHTEILNKV